MNKNMKRRLNDAKIELWYCLIGDTTIDYEDIAWLLSFNSGFADVLYDYSIDLAESCIKGDLGRVKLVVHRLLENADPYDFLEVYRKMLVANYQVESTVFTFFMRTMQLLAELLFDHTVCGFNADTGEIFLEEKYPTLLELIMLLPYEKGYEITTQDKDGKIRIFDKKLMSKCFYFIEDKYTGVDYIDIVMRALREETLLLRVSKDKIYCVANNLCNYGYMIQACQIFNDSYLPQTSADCTIWEREETVSENADMLMMTFRAMVDLVARKVNILEHRNRLVREKGVVLRFAKPFDHINQLLLKEVHQEATDEHYLFIVMQLDCGIQRPLVINLDNQESVYAQMLFQVDVSVTMLVFEWLGVLDDVRDCIHKMSAEEIRKGCGIFSECLDDVLKVKNVFLELLSNKGLIMDTLDNMEVLEPVSWNYTGTRRFNRKVSRKMGEYCELRKVGAYVRRLPEGQQASEEAKKVAERYRMELKPGYTLVSPFVRKQHVRQMDAFKRSALH